MVDARFRVASLSDVLSAGMARVRAARDHDGRTLDSCTRSWDDKYLHSSAAHSTATAFQMVNAMGSLQNLRNLPFHKMQSGATSMVRESGNILDIPKAICTRSSRVLGFVNQYRVHLLMAANSFKAGLVMTVLRVACSGPCTATRFHTADENLRCLLGCGEGPDCSRYYTQCPTLFRSLLSGLVPANVSYWCT